MARYESAFKKFWAFCHVKAFNLFEASLRQIAGYILQFSAYFESEGKQVYGALLKIPGLDQLRFEQLLLPLKRKWNKSNPKYSAFWDAQPLLQQLAQTPLNWECVKEVRDRLIIVCRLVMLCRSVDLQRTWRTVSKVGDNVFILMQRKGWGAPRWELVPQLATRGISPLHLIEHYVALTPAVAAGKQLLYSLNNSKGLLSNSIASLTKKILERHGIDSTHWQPHSTRGAGVVMYKNIGLSAEEVCEVGKWKNTQAFSTHYLRLGASQKAACALDKVVHTVSPVNCAESDMTSTPGNIMKQGGMVMEDGAQRAGETRFIQPADCSC
jgi:hypothetical protein